MKNALLLLTGIMINVVLFGQNMIAGHEVKQKLFEKTGIDPGNGQGFPDSYPSQSQDIGTCPSISWIKQMGGDGADAGQAIVTDAEGNCYVTGYFSGIISFGNNSYSSIGGTDAFTAKFSNGGTLLWFRQISGQSEAIVKGIGIALDGIGNIYITGYFNDTSISVGNIILTRTGIEDLFIVKYNNQGDLLLASHYGVVDEIRQGVKIGADTDGSIYVLNGGGSFASVGCEFFTKMNSNGELEWEIMNWAHYKDMKVKDSMVFLTGFLTTATQFSEIELNGSWSSFSPFIAKCNASGTFIWAVQGVSSQTGNNFNVAYSLIIDGNDDIYISGRLRRDVAFGSFVLSGGESRYVPFLVKCDDNGNFLWARQGVFVNVGWISKYTNPVYVACDSSDNVYLSCQLLNDVFSFEQLSISGSGWCFVKYDTGGNVQWATQKEIAFNSLCISRINKMLSTGTMSGNITVSQNNLALDPVWNVSSIGNSGNATIVNLETDLQGNIYAYAYSFVPTDVFGPVTGNFIAKLNPRGELIWTLPLAGANLKTGYGNYLTLDQDGNIEIMVHFNSSLTIGNYSLMNPAADEAISIAKIDTYGNVLWLKQIGTGQGIGYGTGYCITTDYSNNVIASGIFAGTYSLGPYTFVANGYEQAFIVKYDQYGTLLWAKRAGSDSLDGTVFIAFVSTDSLDNIYLTGEFTTRYITIDMYPLILDEYDGDVVLIKFSADGTVQWAYAYGSDPTGGGEIRKRCWPVAIKTSTAGDSYIYGWTGSANYYGPFFLQSPANYNFFLTKISDSGTVSWANILTETITKNDWHSMQIDLDKSGNCYIGGHIQDTLYIGNNAVVHQGQYDLFVARYDQGGNLDWAKIFGSNPNNIYTPNYDQMNILNAITVYDSNSLYIGGNFEYGLQMDTVVLNSTNVNGFLALLGPEISLGNAILTSASTINSCDSNVVIPVSVNTLNNIGSISLTLNYNDQVLTYTGYQNVDSVLMPGTLLMNENNGTVHIAWFSVSPADFSGGVLLELLFTGEIGSSELTWDTQSQGACHFTDIYNQSVPALFVDGSVNIIPCPDLLGIITYDNLPSTRMNNSEVILKQDGNNISQTLTDSYGYYLFPDLESGVYTLEASTQKPWGGGNAADALLIMRHFVELTQLTGIRYKGADVDTSGIINAVDALVVARRFVELINSFPAGDYTFNSDTVTISGTSDITHNFKALCFGDVDGSYVPEAKSEPLMSLDIDGCISVDPYGEFEIPVRINRSAEVAAISLGIRFPEEELIIEEVYDPDRLMKDDPNTVMVYNLVDGVLKIAWYSLVPKQLNVKEDLFIMKCKLKNTGTPLLSDWGIEPYSSLANAEATPLSDIRIIIPRISIDADNQIFSNNYPNPFFENSVIEYLLPEDGRVKIEILNLLGAVSEVITDDFQTAGKHQCMIDGKEYNTGLYLYRIDFQNESMKSVQTKRLVKL